MIREFRDFLLRGNILDLAVAVIIGGAFGAITKSLVDDVIMQIIAMVGGQPDFSAIKLGAIGIGAFINSIVNFIIIAAVLFFLVIKPVNAMMARMKKPEEAAPAGPSAEEKLLTEIRDLLARR